MTNYKVWLNRLSTLAVLLTLVAALVIPGRVLAEGETPEPPAGSQEVTSAPLADTPVPVETQQPVSSATEPAPTEAITTEPAPSEPAATSEVTEVAPATTAPTVAATATEEATATSSQDTSVDPVSEVMQTATETGMEVTIINNEGEIVPLGSQEAAEIIQADPQFCWEDITNGVITCGASHATLDDALADAYAHSFTSTHKGIIIFEAGTFTGGQTIDPSNWGVNAPPALFEFRGAGQSLTILTSGLTIMNFNQATFYLNNMTIQGGLDFDSNQNTVINLENLTLSNASGNGLSIENQTGAGGAVQLSGVISSGNNMSGAYIEVERSGATVLITNSQFSNNGDYGLYVTANNTVTLDNVTALNNLNHSLVDNDWGANKNIYLLNSSFSSTGSDGIRLYSGGNISISKSSFNSSPGGSGLNAWSNLGMAVYCSEAKNNGMYGYDVGSSGNVYMKGAKASGNPLGWINISGGRLYAEPDFCCSSYCPPPEKEPVLESEGTRFNGDIIIPVYVGTDGNVGTLIGGRNLVFHLLSKNLDGKEDLLAEVKVPSFSTNNGTMFGMKPILLNSPLPPPAGSEMIGSAFIMDVFGLVRTTLTYLNANMQIVFLLPDGFIVPSGMKLAVQYFDQKANTWVAIPSTRVGNKVYAYHDLIGPYALLLVPEK